MDGWMNGWNTMGVDERPTSVDLFNLGTMVVCRVRVEESSIDRSVWQSE